MHWAGPIAFCGVVAADALSPDPEKLGELSTAPTRLS